jgi:hypothetical protein
VESSQVVELMSRMAAGVGVLEYVVVVVWYIFFIFFTIQLEGGDVNM